MTFVAQSIDKISIYDTLLIVEYGYLSESRNNII